MKVVLFAGPRGSGKDTCANILKKDKRVRASAPFALPLKKILSQVFNLHYNMLNDPVLKDNKLREPIKVNIKHLRHIKNLMETYVDPYGEGTFYNLNKATDRLVGAVIETPRQLMQTIGTDFIRNEINPNWHCMAAFSEKNLQDIIKSGNRNVTIAVTDCRFISEFNFIFDKFRDELEMYYVENPEAEENLSKATHSSETEVLEVKKLVLANGGSVIDNSGSVEDLTTLLKDIKVPESTGKPTKVGDKPGSRFKWAAR